METETTDSTERAVFIVACVVALIVVGIVIYRARRNALEASGSKTLNPPVGETITANAEGGGTGAY